MLWTKIMKRHKCTCILSSAGGPDELFSNSLEHLQVK